MDIITSASNDTIKQIKKLVTSAKARREENLAIAEGIHLVRSFLESELTPRLYVCAESALKNDEVTELDEQLSGDGARRIVVTDSLFETMTTVHASVGIAVIFTPQPPSKISNALTENAALLEDIQDPGNLGTILRVTAAAGVHDVFLSSGCASVWSPKVLRAGMGAQFGLNLYENADLATIVSAATVPVLATTLSSKSESLYALDLTGPNAWILGNEGQGVSEQLASLATKHVLIPQADTPVESLNVAAATAVCLYEQYRQQH